jgi:hypothetical protein
MAVEFLSGCLQRQLDPIAVLTELSLKWRMARADINAFPLEKLGAWLGSCLIAYKPSAEAHRQSWAALRDKIVTGIHTKSPVIGADLRDYWDNCLATGKQHDAIFLQCIAELEEAELVSRHGHALSIHAEILKIEPKQKEEVTKAEGMAMVKASAIKLWGPDVWEEKLSHFLRNIPWWRDMHGLALRGLADWVETL